MGPQSASLCDTSPFGRAASHDEISSLAETLDLCLLGDSWCIVSLFLFVWEIFFFVAFEHHKRR